MDRVNSLLVSLDPERDTPQTLGPYTRYFHPNIIGVTGSHAQLADITLRYRADYEAEAADANGEYIVNHSAFVYVIDPQGKLRDLLAHDSHPDEILNSIRNALKVNL